jgi:hypothetical protein
MQPAPEEILHRPRSEPVADLLQDGWIFTRTEPIIEGLLRNFGVGGGCGSGVGDKGEPEAVGEIS